MTHTNTQGLAYLIEDTFEKLAPVMAAQDIADKFQDMLENLGKIQPDDVMPLQDTLSKHYGADVASRFTQAVMEQVNQAIAAMQQAKMAIDAEIKRLETGANGGDMSDLAMDSAATPPGGASVAPGSPPDASGMPETPPPEPGPELPPEGGNEMPPASGEDMEMGGSFAGRPRKESAKPRGKMVREFLDPVAPPAVAPIHPYKSEHFHGNLEGLKAFHGGLGRLARNIEKMIDSGKLNGAEREGLANALSSMASVAHDAGHWVNPESMLQSSLMANHLTDTGDPNTALIVHELRKLAHGLALKHAQVMESSIVALRKARNPDALVLKTFRSKLTEGRDAQLAAIRTARQFAIDVDDVVTIVREAVNKRPIKEDFQQPGNPAPGVPIFPVSQASPAVATQPPNTAMSNPVAQGTPDFVANNQSSSTRKPMTPSDKKAAIIAQNNSAVQQARQTPMGNRQAAEVTDPTQKVTNPKTKKMMAGVGSSPQPNLR
jgi:hypothetical protein